MVASFRKPRKTDARAQAAGNSLRRVIPIIIAQQILRGTGSALGERPDQAHILAVADAYQKMIGGPTVSVAVQAQQQILAGAGQKYRGVVDAFATAMGQRAQGAGA